MARAAQLKLEVITTDFNRMLAALARIDPKIEFSQIIKAEAIAVVRTALSRTKAAKVSAIRRDAEKREFTTFGGKRYFLANRYPTPLWNSIEAQRTKSLQTKLNSRGLSKKSWLHLGALLGANLSAPAYVQNANYNGRTYPEDAAKREEGTAAAYVLTIFNTSPIVQAAGGRRALLSAMRGRVTYFQRNLQHRAFRTIDTRAKAYPGIFVTQTAA